MHGRYLPRAVPVESDRYDANPRSQKRTVCRVKYSALMWFFRTVKRPHKQCRGVGERLKRKSLTRVPRISVPSGRSARAHHWRVLREAGVRDAVCQAHMREGILCRERGGELTARCAAHTWESAPRPSVRMSEDNKAIEWSRLTG